MGVIYNRTTAEEITQKVLSKRDPDAHVEDLLLEALDLMKNEVRGDIESCAFTCAIHPNTSLHNDCEECDDAIEMNVIIDTVLKVKSLQ